MGARVRAADSGDKGLDRRKQELGKLPQNWNEWSMKMQRMNEGCERGEIRFYLQHMVSVIHAIILWILLYLFLPNIHMPFGFSLHHKMLHEYFSSLDACLFHVSNIFGIRHQSM